MNPRTSVPKKRGLKDRAAAASDVGPLLLGLWLGTGVGATVVATSAAGFVTVGPVGVDASQQPSEKSATPISMSC